MPEVPKFKRYDRVKVSYEGHLYTAEVKNVNSGVNPPKYVIRLTGVETRSEDGKLLGWLDLSGGLQFEVNESKLLRIDA
ncbi:hypothetical protein KVR01_005985 [Diaporthe batatas]|uniref:uncharacterized protein n=1 Tax=Diaporthe batatas TaxID=748121 RepID=UPI001D04B348|nr:uncharacterized protein KVR01_005985 [Diaporthe batatas]KAG8164067.1 hypothetical protein KVR01_005985 [Diaporthe batatas]